MENDCDDGKTCIIHYENKDSYSRIKEVNELNEGRIRQAKEEHEKDPSSQHLEQCRMIPTSINRTVHGIHINPCYKLFTRILSGLTSSETNQTGQSRLSRSSSSSSMTGIVGLYPKECYLCKKYRVQYKGKKVLPIQIATNDAVSTIRAAAQAKNEEMYREIKNADLFAKEFKTHDHCYREFTRGYTKKSRDSLEAQDQLENVVKDTPYESGDFDRVKQYINDSVISQGKAASMTILHQMYGLCPGDSRYRHKLKSRIQNYFPSQLLFITAKTNTSEIVISKTIFDNAVHPSIDKHSSIVEVASTIRTDIRDHCKNLPEMSWPPNIEELEQIDMPESLKHFLSTLLSSVNHSSTSNRYVNRLIESFGADIISGVMRGKVMTKKHYLLSLGLHSMTGTRNVITILNSMGHCLHYNKTCEIETAIAESSTILANEKSILPILPVGDETILTFFWVDNFDKNIESLKGGGSIHTTHLMAFQESADEVPNNTTCNVNLPKRKKRKIQIDTHIETRSPIINKNMEPPKFNEVVKSSFTPTRFLSLYDLWLFFRKWNSFDQTLPIFSGWLVNIRKKHSPELIKTTETYLPPILSKVTDYSSIKKYIEYLQSLAASVNMPYTNITLDVGAAMNAFRFLWNNNERYSDVVLHLGSFHFIKENFQVIGNLISGSGFEDVVFQANVCTSGSINGVLSGSHFNRAWFVHNVMSEALERLLLTRFLCEVRPNIRDEFINASNDMARFDDNDLLVYQDLLTQYEQYKTKIRNGELGKTPQFWMTYLDVMKIQHMAHMAIHENDFDMTILAWEEMLPFYFYFNKMNYARYGSYYLQQLNHIEFRHPGLKELLKTKGLSVQGQTSHPVRTAVDQRGEQTINKDAKTTGGIKGFASDSSSVLKWCLNRADQSKNVKLMKEMAGVTAKNALYKSLRPSQILGSEKCVSRVIDVLSEEYLNPFSVLLHENLLYNLSSGVPVEGGLAEQILSAKQRGVEMADLFSAERLVVDGTKKFHEPLSRNKVFSFKNSSKRITVAKKGRERTVEANRDILGMLVRLSLCSGHVVNFEKALSYPLSPIPLSIATPDGERREATKSKLMNVILCKTEEAPSHPKSVIRIMKDKPSALVVDLIAAIRTMTQLPETYSEFTWKLLDSLPKGYKRVDLVADTYKPISIKNAERQKRGTSDRLFINSAQSKLPRDFTAFLKNGENKTRLIELAFDVISQDCSKALQILRCNQIYLSKENHTAVIDSEGKRDAEHLKSNQEEADTKVILHCLDALEMPDATVVLRSHSGDTDIMVLAVSLIRNHCERLFIDYGSGKNRKALRLSNISMNEAEKDALLGFHAFSGNDYISGFFKKGKCVAWKCMLKKPRFVRLFADFGNTLQVDQSTMVLLEEFLCNLYGQNSQDINNTRYKLFQKKVAKGKKAPDMTFLPPCRSTLRLHVRRAVFVANMWRSTPTSWLNLPDITGYGWEIDGTPIWIEEAFPDDVAALLLEDVDEEGDDTEDESEESESESEKSESESEAEEVDADDGNDDEDEKLNR